MTIITQPRTPMLNYVVQIKTSLGRNQIQKSSINYTAVYDTPNTRTEEKSIELPAGSVYESNMAEEYTNVAVSTSAPISLAATFQTGVATNLVVNKMFVCDSRLLHFTLLNNGLTVARIQLNTVSEAANAPLGQIYLGAAVKPLVYDEQFVKSLPAVTGAKDRTFDANAGALEKIFYCYPSVYGNSQFEVNGFVGGFTLSAQVVVNTSTGNVVYNVYESDNAGLGVTTVTVLS